MAPPSWATDKQAKLLTDYIPLYETYQESTKRYQPFWDVVNAAFLKEWPVLPPGSNPEAFNEAESKVYSDNLAKLYKRIKQWYRWRCGTRSRNTSTTVTSKDLKDIYAESGSRNAKEYEVFVRLNPDLFQSLYDAECKREGLSGRDRLPVWHKVAVGLWEKATEEQKEAVHADIAAAKEAEATEQPDPRTPSDYQKYWEKLPAILSKTVTPPVQKAGVLAFVTLIGPVPEAGGQILATTLQFGDKQDTPLFSNAWADHDRVLVDQLANFARRYEFTPEDCAKRSLLLTQKVEDVSLEDRDSAKEATEGQVASEEADGSGASSSKDTPVNRDTSSSSSANPLASEAVVAPGGSSTSHSGPSSEVTNSDMPVLTEPQTTVIANEAFDFSKFNLDDFDVPNFWPNGEPDWANVEVLESMMRSNEPEEPALPSFTTTTFPQLAASAYASAFIPEQSSSLVAPVAPAATAPNGNGPETLETANAPHAHHAPPSKIAISAPTLAIPATTPLHASPLNTAGSTLANTYPAALPPVHTPVQTVFPPAAPAVHIGGPPPKPFLMKPTTLQAPAPALATTIPPTHHAPAPNMAISAPPAVEPPATHAPAPVVSVAPSHQTPAHGASMLAPSTFHAHHGTPIFQPPAPSSSSFQVPAPLTSQTPPNTQSPGFHLIPPTTTSDAPGPNSGNNRAPFGDLENGVRRSNRAPVPSTRLDKLNEIGDNIVTQKPSMVALGSNEEPAWFAPAHEHLKRDSLGAGWSGLIAKWAEYEHFMGWKSAKGLPAKNRLEEWSRWTAKARQGVRNYRNIPNVEDAAEFGIAITKWVGSFNDSDFGRTGPNGMVALLCLMGWWGAAALTPTSWNGDSRPQWNALCQTLLCRLEGLLGKTSATKRSREVGSDEDHENKRPQMDSAAFLSFAT